MFSQKMRSDGKFFMTDEWTPQKFFVQFFYFFQKKEWLSADKKG